MLSFMIPTTHSFTLILLLLLLHIPILPYSLFPISLHYMILHMCPHSFTYSYLMVLCAPPHITSSLTPYYLAPYLLSFYSILFQLHSHSFLYCVYPLDAFYPCVTSVVWYCLAMACTYPAMTLLEIFGSDLSGYPSIAGKIPLVLW